MTGGDHNFGAGRSDLICFYPSRCHADRFVLRSHRHDAAAAAAAMIMIAIGRHIPEVFSDIRDDFAGLVPESAVSRNIARVLVGDGFLNFFGGVYFQTAVSQIFIHQPDVVHNLNRWLAAFIACQIRAFKSEGTVSMPALGD